ncbi:MAG: NAD(P)/FAD-dependent oxidoreductase [Clostridiaceae bacterium]|nr:NAD(P)/FAD-dependent oxidoreductase [Clostridiaceae bacterium]
MKEKSIIVVGGGIAGLTAALTLAKSGKEVLLLEKNEKCGGLMSTFTKDGFRFEAGARALVNAGLIKPLIKEFDLDIEVLPNPITLGIEDNLLRIEGEESLLRYADLLKDLYPGSRPEVDRIIESIQNIIENMKVLYGANNPLFAKKKNYLLLLPSMICWMAKLMRTLYRIQKMDTPFEEHLDLLSENQSLKDMIGQHFFKKTPVFFALSYFALYNDYLYPKGGVGAFIQKLVEAFEKRGGEIRYQTEITRVDAHNKRLCDSEGNEYEYQKMIWTGDLKTLYDIADDEGLEKDSLLKFREKRQAILSHKGAESVFSAFLAVDLPPEYFREKASAHLFYTPDRKGLGTIHTLELQELLNRWDSVTREDLFSWLERFCRLNTFEISIPVLRDADAAPSGKTGMIISVLFDYELIRCIRDRGWYDEFTKEFEAQVIHAVSSGIYPDMREKVLFRFSTTPISIYDRVGSSEGSIVGWSFEEKIPAVTNMFKMADSVKTELPDVYAAGKWVYSPAGGPTAIMTGRIAAKKCK